MKLTAGIGSIVNVRVAFTDPDNSDAAYDPDTVSIRMRTPGLVATDYEYGTDDEVVKESTGNYLFRLTLEEEGTYRWTWTGSSPQKAVAISGLTDAEEGV